MPEALCAKSVPAASSGSANEGWPKNVRISACSFKYSAVATSPYLLIKSMPPTCVLLDPPDVLDFKLASFFLSMAEMRLSTGILDATIVNDGHST